MIARFWRLVDNYLLARIVGRPSTAGFWYSPDPPAVNDQVSFDAYKASWPSPFYPIDYRSRTSFPLKNRANIVVLPYPEPIGIQLNPEAAFQTALGYHDEWVKEEKELSKLRFLAYADFFLQYQTSEGHWPYLFDWHENKAPWHSALAQARGASVMLRAFLITGDMRYKQAAEMAISHFEMPSDKGGYLSYFEPAEAWYFEEYPAQENVTLNGFLATIFGLWELAHWLGSDFAKRQLGLAVEAAEKMLPLYTISWWTLYDSLIVRGRANIHSPRYHKMCVGYLTALALLTGSPIIAEYRDLWKNMDRFPNRARAYIRKAITKLVYR